MWTVKISLEKNLSFLKMIEIVGLEYDFIWSAKKNNITRSCYKTTILI